MRNKEEYILAFLVFLIVLVVLTIILTSSVLPLAIPALLFLVVAPFVPFHPLLDQQD
jgi:hypothetical protein